MTCKHGDKTCGTTTYQCQKCEREEWENAGRRLTPQQHAYDLWALSGSRGQDDEQE